MFKGMVVADDDYCYSGQLRGRLDGFACGCSECRAHWPEARRKELEDWMNSSSIGSERSISLTLPNAEPKQLKQLLRKLSGTRNYSSGLEPT